MKPSHLSLLWITALFFASCGKKEPVSTGRTTGSINSVVVMIDDPLWNGEIGDSIRKKLAAPVDGLPQEEPLFNINQYPLRVMETFRGVPRNIVVIEEGKEPAFSIVRDEYAKPQIAVHISGTPEEIIGNLEIYSDSIVNTFKAGEIGVSQVNMQQNRLDDTKIRQKFGVSLTVPSGFHYAMEKRNFLWLKHDILSGSSSLLIYTVPLRNIQKHGNYVTNIIRVRDSIGRLFIHGKAKRSRMITEESYSPYFFVTTLDGKRAYETKGTWELRNDYMNGPFINYAVIDRKRRRCLVIEGFCYAPSAQKRDLMHELEAAIRSLQTLSK